ncbi:hypothetical protein [Burkholderia vietnamiensis]|uniref:hypothetical protein n=1 Tax=Burkholderia vietnamiensis TaxID=60552 RepID=UPI000A4F068C|nr:hypothetical protein [Burkholderia vietnamiensis]MCA8292116.1 hypothetical protein [Burkholderia vietnamiensis]HDR8964630.1 hypothetical protein [Burkholderia vietnamiensis]HDR9240187.1 hypothetical protein [Burkholderia vietnamiensis]
MSKPKKSARFYKVDKRDGRGETWTYFVPGQNANSVKSDAEQQHVATEVSVYGWHEVSVEIAHDGVYFSATVDGSELEFWPGHEGFEYLKAYLGPEYAEALDSYR